MLPHLIVLGLSYRARDEHLNEYFKRYGELEVCQVKTNRKTKLSRGFGVIRFKKHEAVEAVLAGPHFILNRRCEVCLPRSSPTTRTDNITTKLFVGKLPRGTTTFDLRCYFETFGVLKDAYIPPNFRGFGFVRYVSEEATRHALRSSHVIKGCLVNVSKAEPRKYNGVEHVRQQSKWKGRGGTKRPDIYGY